VLLRERRTFSNDSEETRSRNRKSRDFTLSVPNHSLSRLKLQLNYLLKYAGPLCKRALLSLCSFSMGLTFLSTFSTLRQHSLPAAVHTTLGDRSNENATRLGREASLSHFELLPSLPRNPSRQTVSRLRSRKLSR